MEKIGIFQNDFKMILNEILRKLENVDVDWEYYDLVDSMLILDNIKNESLKNGDQEKAKFIWCIEECIKIQSIFLTAYYDLKEEKFYAAWKNYERIEIKVIFLKKHLSMKHYTSLKIEFIEEYTEKLQKLYPYKTFVSPEFEIGKTLCSICNNKINLRNHCGHKVGEIYDGKLCLRILKDLNFTALSIVNNPVQKYSVLFSSEGDYHNYGVIKYLSAAISSPFDIWEFRKTKKRHPLHFYPNLNKNENCPCNSEKKYKKCCMRKGGILQDHFQFKFGFDVPKEVPIIEYANTDKGDLDKLLKERLFKMNFYDFNKSNHIE